MNKILVLKGQTAMSCSKNDKIHDWLVQAKKNGASHLIIVADEFTWEDHPIEIENGQSVYEAVRFYNSASSLRVMKIIPVNQKLT